MLKLLNLEKNIKRFFKNLKRFPKAEQKIIKKAYRLARKSHAKVMRDEGVLYIIHPIRMANILIEKLNIKDPSIIAATLLHDVVEDTAVTITQIKKVFNLQIYQLVKGMTRYRPKNESMKQKKKSKKKNYKMILKAGRELRLIKSVDILDNMSSWHLIPEGHEAQKKFTRWLEEAKLYYLPLTKKTDNYLYQETKKTLSLFKKKYEKRK